MGPRLSGGERHALVVGRALMINLRALVLDELGAGLAPPIQEDIWRTPSARAKGPATFVIDNDLDTIAALADAPLVPQTAEVVWRSVGVATTDEPGP